MIHRSCRAAPVVLLLALLLFPGLSAAADPPPSTIRVEQDRLDVAVPPGEKFTGTVSLINLTQNPVTVRFYASDRRVRPGGKVETTRGARLTTSAAPWLSPSPYDESLAPRERKEFTWTVVVPDMGVAPGDYVAVLYAEVVPRTPVAPGTAERVGTLVVVNVPGTATNEGRITQMASPPERIGLLPKLPRLPNPSLSIPDWLRQAQPISVYFTFVNQGTSRVRAEGDLVVMASSGASVATIPAGVVEEVFPGDAADFAAVWDNPPASGSFRLVARVDTGGSRPIEEVLVVHVLRWPLLPAGLLVLVLAVGVGGWLVWRRRNRGFDDLPYLADGTGEPSEAGGRGLAGFLGRRRRASTSRHEVAPAGGPAPGGPDWAAGAPEVRPMEREERPSNLQRRSGNSWNGPPPRREPPPRPSSYESPGAPTAGGNTRAPRGVARSQEVERLMGAGLAAVHLGAYPDAHDYFSAALSRDENCVEAWLLKAGTAESPAEAEECLHRVLMLDPNNAWAVEGLRLLAEARQ